MRSIVVFFALLIMLSGAFPLFGQAQLEGELVIDSVVGHHISMRLIVTNVGDQTFFWENNNNEMSFYSLNSVEYHNPGLPIIVTLTLEPGDSVTYDMEHVDPLPDGVYVVRAFLAYYDVDMNPLMLGAPQTVFIGDGDTITIGAGDQLSRVPIDFFWRTSLYECVFLAAEMSYTPATITSITFYSEFSQQPFMFQHVRVYLANVDQPDLSAGWIDPAMLVPVFDGLLNIPMGSNAINVPLDQGFFYGGGNLGLAVFRLIPSSYQFGAEPFRVQEADLVRSRKRYSDYMDLDPMLDPDALPSQHVGIMPMTSFHVYPSGVINDAELVPRPLSASSYPNPARQSCEIRLNLAKAAQASVDIYNLRGQKVRTLEGAEALAEHHLVWDLRDQSGKPCQAGIYLYRAFAGKTGITGKMILLP